MIINLFESSAFMIKIKEKSFSLLSPISYLRLFLMQNFTVFFTQKMAVEVKQNNICTSPVCMIQIHFQAIHDVGHSKCWRPRDSCSTVDQD